MNICQSNALKTVTIFFWLHKQWIIQLCRLIKYRSNAPDLNVTNNMYDITIHYEFLYPILSAYSQTALHAFICPKQSTAAAIQHTTVTNPIFARQPTERIPSATRTGSPSSVLIRPFIAKARRITDRTALPMAITDSTMVPDWNSIWGLYTQEKGKI